MQGKNHIALALAAPLGLALFPATADLIGLPATWPSWAGLLAGSLAPDLDGGGAITRPSNFLPDLTPKPVLIILDQIGLTISKLIQAILGHRGPLHWPIIGALLVVTGIRLGPTWLVWFGIGYLLHILGDLVTRQGVPLLGPISQKKVSLLPMRVGGWLENIFGLLLWGGVAYSLALLYLPDRYALAREAALSFWSLVAHHLALK